MFVMYLTKDLHPHHITYIGYFLRYLVLNWTY